MSASDACDRMQCMEVWGGNARVTRNFEVSGLEVWLESQPHERAESGGDVYYVSTCASGRITRLLLADVSGHGQSVADSAVGLRDLMRRNINLITQTRFVRQLNQQFSRDPEGETFATAVAFTYFRPTQVLQFCNAGHPFPLVFRNDDSSWHSISHSTEAQATRIERGQGLSDTPLGVVEEANYSSFRTKLTPGDIVLCVSDAFTESRDASGNLIGSDGLLEIVRGLGDVDAAQIIPLLRNQIAQMYPQNLQQDDATAILFRASGTSPTLANNVMAPIRLLNGVRQNTSIA